MREAPLLDVVVDGDGPPPRVAVVSLAQVNRSTGADLGESCAVRAGQTPRSTSLSSSGRSPSPRTGATTTSTTRHGCWRPGGARAAGRGRGHRAARDRQCRAVGARSPSRADRRRARACPRRAAPVPAGRSARGGVPVAGDEGVRAASARTAGGRRLPGAVTSGRGRDCLPPRGHAGRRRPALVARPSGWSRPRPGRIGRCGVRAGGRPSFT